MILLLGPTGSGKTVQGQMLADRHGWVWISAGNLLREVNDPAINQMMLKGIMIPHDTINKLVFERIAKSKTASEERKFILDGYPREAEQAATLTKFEFDRTGREPIDIVIDLRITKEEIAKRLSLRGRAEDSPKVIADRLKLHDKQTKEIKDYYSALNVPIVTIDGVGTVGEVHDRIEKVLEDRQVLGAF
ncbi:MAG: nucleoside monophosphate kinase [Candidatus Nomurabacteria bacterium]|nr:nucleoside monophosphate kinase [Candidatus Nomurabacteria bacterium]